MPKKISSEPQACAKCLKKYGQDLENWEPCKNCSWVTKETEQENLPSGKNLKKNEKICLECQGVLKFLEVEESKYLCGKNKCLREYIKKKELRK